jgi:hypothetical protein
MQPKVRLKPYFHHVPGRLRVRTASVKHNPSAAASVRVRLSAASGVTSSEVSTVTGSILVHYDVRLTSATAICSILDEHDCSTDVPEVAAPVIEHVHRREHHTVRRPIRRTLRERSPRLTFEHASTKILTFLFQMLLEQAIETALKRSALLLIAMIL